MTYFSNQRAGAAMLLGAALITAAGAQEATPVRTDTGPPPAEDRNSPGAVVLDKSLTQAQRNNAFTESAARTGIGSVGQGALRVTRREEVRAALADARAEQAVERRRERAESQGGP